MRGLQNGKGKVIPQALRHEGLYGQCLNLVSVVRSNLECSYTDSPGRDTSPYLQNSVCTHFQLSRLKQSRVNEIA